MHILILSKGRSLLSALNKSLRDKGHQVKTASTVEEGGPIIQSDWFDALIWRPSDYDRTLQDRVMDEIPDRAKRITISGTDDEPLDPGESVSRKEAHFSRPVDLQRLHRFLDGSESAQNENSPEGPRETPDYRDDITTLNTEMKRVFQRARKIGPLDCNVLLVGETGTGKELVAREIHRAGNTEDNEFIGVSCPGFSENLLESELFGFREGSFTGADENRKGFFEEASRGTLLLDEIGSMGRDLQAKLLRVLEEEEFYRIGSVDAIEETPRIIAATNKSPETLIEDDTFRRDLYYRLNVVELRLPPLRERVEDVLPLTNAFIRTFNDTYETEVIGVTADVQQWLRQHRWTGNVRELRNTIESAVIFTGDGMIEMSDLPESIRETGQTNTSFTNAQSSFSEMVRSFKKHIIESAIARANGDRKEAARRLDINRSTIYRNLEEEEE